MKIRDIHAVLSNDTTVHEMPNGGLEIVADDGRPLFNIRLLRDGGIEVTAGHVCVHQDVMLDDRLVILPNSSNMVTLQRPVYK